MEYHEFEKRVYDALIKEHDNNSAFTFSLRQKSSKGSERDYFIGTKKSGYFGFTLWTIPVAFPGSSSDMINCFLQYRGSDKFSYKFEFNQTKDPFNEQNRAALQLVRVLRPLVEKVFRIERASDESNKMESFIAQNQLFTWDEFDKFIPEMIKNLYTLKTIVLEGIEEVKKRYPDFVAHEITKSEFEAFQKRLEWRFNKYPENSITDSSKESDNEDKDGDGQIEQINFPLNQILYGPPGTGKTYATVKKAIAIIENREEEELEDDSYSDLKKRYDNYVKSGQIVFTTFHQSMTYEDFVEGIKPLPPKGDGDSISYDVEDGLFKTIANAARNNFGLSKVREQNTAETPFEIAFQMLEDKVIEANLEEGSSSPGEMKEGLLIKRPNTYFCITEVRGTSIRMMTRSGNKRNTMTKGTLKKIYENPEQAEEIITGGMLGYYQALVQTMQGWSSMIKNEATRAHSKNYVLIIDEINRGNVSAIFGELITLLEESKRYGNQESIELKLPYSKDFFSVPKNLFIIGTMNTADRSVEALDTALRRRFVFTEMQPNPSLVSPWDMVYRLWMKENYRDLDWDEEPYNSKSLELYSLLGIEKSFEEKFYEGEPEEDWSLEDIQDRLKADDFTGIDLEHLLRILNHRIHVLLDRDHLIGHSYFMRVNSLHDLKTAFAKEIIPLLQEYFFGDYAKIGLVLGEGFCKAEKKSTNEKLFAKFSTPFDIGSYNDKITYSIEPVQDMGDEEFRIALDLLLNKGE